MNRRIFPPIAIGTILILAVLVSSYFRSEARKVAPSVPPAAPPANETPICTDSDNGKDIYAKGSAATKKGEQTLHINSDSCATKNEIKFDENAADYVQGLASCSGGSCYVRESYCGGNNESPLDAGEFIKCPNGCADGACLAEEVAKPVTVDVSNWQTYSDAKNNFEFKYPQGFIKQKATSSNNLLYLEKSSGGSLESIHIYLRKNFQIAGELPESKGKIIEVNGRSVYKYFFQEGTGYSGVAFVQMDQDALEILYDAIGEENGGQSVKEDLVKNNLEQILSTFKAADAVDGITSWQTYRNEEYRFELKYPLSWVLNNLNNEFKDKNGEKVMLISLGDSAILGISYCAVHIGDKRCEKVAMNNELFAIIDWADWESSSEASASTSISIDERRILFITYYKTSDSSREQFRQILSTFKFIN